MNDNKKNHNKKSILGRKYNKNILLLITGLILILLDQILKYVFLERSYSYKLFSIHLVKNTGMSFGFLQGRVILMIIISVLFLGLLWFFRKEFKNCQFGLMLLAAGTIGNLIDRVFRGYVVDFFDLGWFPVFNLSDALITLGTIGIIWAFLMEIKKESKENKTRNKEKIKHK